VINGRVRGREEEEGGKRGRNNKKRGIRAGVEGKENGG